MIRERTKEIIPIFKRLSRKHDSTLLTRKESVAVMERLIRGTNPTQEHRKHNIKDENPGWGADTWGG